MKDEILAACFIFGVGVRYMQALSQGCLFIGRAISSDGSKTGFQDAITPPIATNATILLWALSVAVVGYAIWHGPFALGAEAAFSLIFWVFVSGYVLPKPRSGHWVRLVFRSLIGRSARYEKAGDMMRAEAASMLADRIGAIFKGELAGNSVQP